MILALLLACATEGRSQAQIARDAFTRANEGDPAGCRDLADADMAGFCAFTAVVARRDAPDASGCAAVPAGEWRDECYFERADQLVLTGDPAQVVRICADAGGFRQDCARHVSVQAFRREGGLSPAFRTALAEVAPELDPDGGWVGQTRHQVYVDRARHAAHFRAADCATEEDPPGCVAAMGEVVQLRWERLARKHKLARDVLCAAATRGELPAVDEKLVRLRLGWDAHPVLDDAVRRAQRDVCGG